MNKFERVKRFPNAIIPQRGTRFSAGYDFHAAEDVLVPSLVRSVAGKYSEESSLLLSQIKDFLKKNPPLRPVLVSTGVKVKLEADCYLSISARSSLPRNSLLMIANAPGIIDADYYNNSQNEGEIFIQLINLSPYDIIIKQGDKIAQGVIHRYIQVEDDDSLGEREGGFGSTGGR